MSDAYPIGAMDVHLHPARKPNKLVMVESKKDLSLVGPQSLLVDNRDNLLGLAVTTRGSRPHQGQMPAVAKRAHGVLAVNSLVGH